MSIFATNGDEIAIYEVKKEKLSFENKKLQQEIAEARNLQNIKSKFSSAGYVDIENNEVGYLEVR